MWCIDGGAGAGFEDAFENQTNVCNDKPTRAERKACKRKNVEDGIACDAALYCPPDGTKPPPP